MSENGEPKWRKDFPIEWGADHYVTRREFTKFLVLTSGATLVGNGYFVLRRNVDQQQKHARVEIANEADIANGTVKLFRYPTEDDPAILIRLEDGKFVAYKQRCTHLSCPVEFSAERKRLECPCHNGAFDAATGEVLEGPPPRPLPRITLTMSDNKVYAEGVVGA